jgi:tetratricopeptide (TPR) repeat protein
MGASLAALARYDEAIDQYPAALEQIPSNSELRLNLALAFYKKGALPLRWTSSTESGIPE